MFKIFRASVGAASKPYRCAATGKSIPKGSRYVSVFGLKDGKPAKATYRLGHAPAEVVRRLPAKDRREGAG